MNTDGATRSTAVRVYLTPGEKETLRNVAEKEGTSMSSFAQDAIVREVREALREQAGNGEPPEDLRELPT